ncbi:GNAT family N-acetyltransferase [Neobacillus mesonae]|nr:GNAT family N-acetyltransferase [Neobacillus mesonae]
MEIRKYQYGEESQLREVFVSSIRENAKNDYSAQQLEAWAPDHINSEAWKDRIKNINPYVVIDGSEILGYADLQDTGYIDHFFVRGGHAGKGIGKLLMKHILKEAKEKKLLQLTSHVSLTAQDFYRKFGFDIVERKKVLKRGIELENALMRKRLTDS